MAKNKSRVAVLRTKPATVREDYHRLMNLARYQEHIDKTADTGLKVNISWHFFYPGASTVPWQHRGIFEVMDGTFAGDGPATRDGEEHYRALFEDLTRRVGCDCTYSS